LRLFHNYTWPVHCSLHSLHYDDFVKTTEF
jgi:hypothetical protein